MPRKKIAGTSMTWKKRNSGISVTMRDCGYSTKYAPITPAMAPLAPTIGTIESGSMMVCASAAADAAQQVEHEEAAVSHAVLDVVAEDPEISMLPATCRMPPWRNIEVNTVTHEKRGGHEAEVQRERVDPRGRARARTGRRAR